MIRIWIGTVALAVLGIGLSAVAIWQTWPLGWRIVLVVGTIVAVGLTVPLRRQPSDRSTFIKGPVVNSLMHNVESDAHTFIDGAVHGSLLGHIVQRQRDSKRD